MSPTRKSIKRSVIVQTGRSAKGRSETSEGAPGESATATGGKGAKGSKGGSAIAKGRAATAGSVKIHTTES